MFCTHCGKRNADSARFCFACGTPLVVGDQSPDVRDPFRLPTVVATFLAFLNQKRPTGVTLLAVLQFIAGAVWLLLAVGLMAAAAVDPSQHSLIADLLDIGPSPLS